MNFSYRFGFIGTGNMGFAIMKGLLKTLRKMLNGQKM